MTDAGERAVVIALCMELRNRRQARRLTQQQVARAVGTSQARISRIERGGEIPRLDLLCRLCASLGLQIRLDAS